MVSGGRGDERLRVELMSDRESQQSISCGQDCGIRAGSSKEEQRRRDCCGVRRRNDGSVNCVLLCDNSQEQATAW